MKHITEASERAEQHFPSFLPANEQRRNDYLWGWSDAFDFSSPQPPEGVAELVAAADEWVQEENWESSYETDGFNRPGTELIVKLRNALAALSSVPVVTPSDEELRQRVADCLREVYTCSRVWEAWQYNTMTEDDFAPAWESDDLIDDLVAALSSAEGTKR